jgi:hypothetical protein
MRIASYRLRASERVLCCEQSKPNVSFTIYIQHRLHLLDVAESITMKAKEILPKRLVPPCEARIPRCVHHCRSVHIASSISRTVSTTPLA